MNADAVKNDYGYGYGIPYIPLSQLRHLYKNAQELNENLDAKELWTLFVRCEVDRIVIQDLQNKNQRLVETLSGLVAAAMDQVRDQQASIKRLGERLK